jgi:hypothetical protein
MGSTIRTLCAAGLALALVGCAGGNFVRPTSESVTNGQTTYSQIVEKMGQPGWEGTNLKNDKTIKSAVYIDARAGGFKRFLIRSNAVRGIAFYFYNEVLVGHKFVSSSAEDHTDFDEGKIPSIVKGETTRRKVVQIMGEPSGYYVYPLIKSPTGEAAVYEFDESSWSGVGSGLKLKTFNKLLVVTFDPSGVVEEVEYTSMGNK